MPKAPFQDMFKQEICGHCNKPGVLFITHRGTYLWRCPTRGISWWTEGSDLALFNDIIDPYNEEPNEDDNE